MVPTFRYLCIRERNRYLAYSIRRGFDRMQILTIRGLIFKFN